MAEARREARGLLAGRFSEDERELAYRLGLVARPFRRTHMLKIAEIAPGIRLPGDVFERLLGPWVESLADEQFRVSPLLENTADEIWTTQQQRQMHADIARAVFACRPLFVSDAGLVILHAMRGQVPGLVLGMVGSLIGNSVSEWRRAAPHLAWMIQPERVPGAPVFSPERPADNAWFRLLQFRVAAELQPQAAAAIVDLWDRDIRAVADPDDASVLRGLQATLVLSSYQVPVGARRLVSLLTWVGASREQTAGQGKLSLKEMFGKMTSSLGHDTGEETIRSFAIMIVARATNSHFLNELLDALGEAPAEIRAQFIEAVRGEFVARTTLVNKPWTEEAARPEPDLRFSLEVLEKVYAHAWEWNVPGLAEEATRAICVIYEEYLHQPDRADAALVRLEAVLGETPMTRNVRAGHFAHRKDPAATLAILEPLLPTWIPADDGERTQKMLANRQAAIAAAKLGRWERAAGFFAHGREGATAMGETILTTGLLADRAFALWRTGDGTGFVSSFAQVLREIESFPDRQTNFQAWAMNKFAGLILLWVNNTLAPLRTKDLTEPVPGMCSQLEPDKRLRDLEDSPGDVLWLHLAEIELYLRQGTGVYHAVKKRLRTSPRPVIRFRFAFLTLEHALQGLDLASLPKLGFDVQAAHRVVNALKEAGRSALAPMDENDPVWHTSGANHQVGYELFLSALIAIAADGRSCAGAV